MSVKSNKRVFEVYVREEDWYECYGLYLGCLGVVDESRQRVTTLQSLYTNVSNYRHVWSKTLSGLYQTLVHRNLFIFKTRTEKGGTRRGKVWT